MHMNSIREIKAVMQAVSTYKLFAANSERALSDIANRPQVSRETENYLARIDNISSAEELVSDTRVFNYVMRAYGLEEMSYAKAMVRRVLEGGIDDDKALANQLTDSRFKQLATDFNFARYGETTTTFERTRTGVVDKYYQQTMEIDAGERSDGARLAMYFKRKAGEVENTYSILADPALLKVVQTVFQLPAEMSYLDIEKQAEMINKRLDIEDLSDPEKIDKLISRFLPLWDISGEEVVSVPPLVTLFSNTNTLSVDLLTSIQNMKKF